MNVKSVFVVHSVIAFVFGVSFLLAPAQVLSFYGREVTDVGLHLGRFFGATLLAIAAVVWLARDAVDGIALQAIIKGIFAALVIGALVALQGVLTGAVNALGWGSVLIYAALAFCYSKLLVAPG